MQAGLQAGLDYARLVWSLSRYDEAVSMQYQPLAPHGHLSV